MPQVKSDNFGCSIYPIDINMYNVYTNNKYLSVLCISRIRVSCHQKTILNAKLPTIAISL